METNKEKILTIILDGWGYREERDNNAIAIANTPNFDKIWADCPHALLDAAGEAVGLPPGQMGTSEVNHMTLGTGRIIYQDLMRIENAIKDRSYYDNSAFVKAFDHVKKYKSKLHIQGLVSDGGVHTRETHLIELLKAAALHGVKDQVYVHFFADGRDTPAKSALKYLAILENAMKEIGLGEIASVSGRYYPMDRDKKFDRVDKFFDIITKQGAGKKFKTAKDAIEDSYKNNVTDEYIIPVKVEVNRKEKEACVEENDAIIFFNFRRDRTVEITSRFLTKGPKNLMYVTMADVVGLKTEVAFQPDKVTKILSEVLAENHINQFRITETEKYAHLTFFMNATIESSFEGEDRLHLDSYSDVKTHDEKPQMRTPDLAKHLVSVIKTGKYQTIFTNICNADMVGHTANPGPIIKAVETVDAALGELLEAAKKEGYHVIVTADHGNAEEMVDPKTGVPSTAHTLNPVPFIFVSDKYKEINRNRGGLYDIAPTILDILGIKQPKEMTGKSFIPKK